MQIIYNHLQEYRGGTFMNDIMEGVKSYLSAGFVLLRGKRLLVYACLLVITLASMIPSTIKLVLDPDIRTIIPDTAGSVYELIDPDTSSSRRTTQTDTEFKSQGEILGEQLAAKREASRKAAMAYLEKLIDWIYAALIGDVLIVGLYSMYLRLSKREVGFKDLFSGFTSGHYGNVVLALLLKKGILMLIAVLGILAASALPYVFALSLAILIVGLIVNYALFMVEFIMADDPSISFIRAIQISVKASSGYKAILFVIDLFTATIPSWVGTFAIMFFMFRSEFIEDNGNGIILALLAFFGLELFLMLIRPIREGAFAAAYEDAKMTGKSYGYISQFEFYDPEDQIDNTDDGGMMFFG